MKKKYTLALYLFMITFSLVYSQSEENQADLKHIIKVCVKKYDRALNGHYSVNYTSASSY